MNRNIFLRKIFGRFLRAVSISFWVMVISFSLIRLSPGDPASARLGAGAEPEAIEQLREQLGLNRGIFTQFIDYLKNLLQGDLGVSLVNGVDVLETIKRTFPLTLTYITLSVLLAFLISIPIGTIIGWSNKASTVYVFRGLTSIIIATPNFFIAMIGILLFSVTRNWAPLFGYVSDFPENLKYLWLPVSINSLILVAIISRVLHTSVVDTKAEEFVETGIIRGVSRPRFFWFYILKPSLAPTVVLMSYMMGTMLGATVILETIFSLPGIGRELVGAVLASDYPMVQGILLIFGVITVFLSFIGDLLAYALDRRVKL
ncbi:MAG: ABC transporter permease [Candidatus Planktophila sp.]|nr:ABC transporter permease [Candidatus Planktophila sp.]